MIFIVVIVYFTIGYFEILRLVKEKKRKEISAYSVIMGLAFLISVLITLGIKVPSPANGIESIVLFFRGK